MNIEELEESLAELMPSFKMRKDNNGQIVIYSGLVDDGMGDLVSMDNDDEIELPENEDFLPLEDEE